MRILELIPFSSNSFSSFSRVQTKKGGILSWKQTTNLKRLVSWYLDLWAAENIKQLILKSILSQLRWWIYWEIRKGICQLILQQTIPLQVKLEEMTTNEVSLIKVRELSRNLSKEDRHTPHLQAGVKRIDDRWSKALATLEDRQKQLTAALESGPPRQFLSTMDAVLLKIKNMESQLGSEFLITDTASLEEQLQKYKVSKKCCTAPMMQYALLCRR